MTVPFEWEQFIVQDGKPDGAQAALERLYKAGPAEWHKVRQRMESREHFDAETGCIDWHGRYSKSGTALVWLYGCHVSVARVMWVCSGKSPVIPQQRLRSVCLRQSCIAPSHREPDHAITIANRLKTSCKSGHEYSPKNTVHYRGRRYCVRCYGQDVDDLAMQLFSFQGRRENAFGYFQWDEAAERYTTKEERDGEEQTLDS